MYLLNCEQHHRWMGIPWFGKLKNEDHWEAVIHLAKAAGAAPGPGGAPLLFDRGHSARQARATPKQLSLSSQAHLFFSHLDSFPPIQGSQSQHNSWAGRRTEVKCHECVLCFTYLVSLKSHNSLWSELLITPHLVSMTYSKSPHRKVERSVFRFGQPCPSSPQGLTTLSHW